MPQCNQEYCKKQDRHIRELEKTISRYKEALLFLDAQYGPGQSYTTCGVNPGDIARAALNEKGEA